MSLTQRTEESNREESNREELHTEEFLNAYILEHDLEEAYLVIQGIYKMVSDIKQEVDSLGLIFMQESAKGKWSPYPGYFQTKQGFELHVDSGVNHLSTPLGEVQLFGGGTYGGYVKESIAEAFLYRLGCYLDTSNNKAKKYISRPKGYEGKVREIFEADLKDFKDLNHLEDIQDLVLTYYSGKYSIYKITKLDDKPLPQVIGYESYNDQKPEDILREVWKLLEKKYT